MDSSDTNAVAGPSNLRSPLSHPSSTAHPFNNTPHPNLSRPSQLFLPPPGPSQLPAYIKSTQDLLGQFHLHDAYDKYVRPFIASSEDSAIPNDRNGSITSSSLPNAGQTGSLGISDKGKGKEVVPPQMVQTPAADGQDADDDDGPGGKGEKKKKNSYKHLIKGVPGKHSMKKDDYLTNLMSAPPKQRVRISEFDSRTQRDAFTVSLEGLKGWNPSALVLESAQAREDRKKRKELKRLAKAQIQAQSQASTQQPSPAASTPIQAPIPTSATSSSFPNTTSAPRPSNVSSTPRPSGTGTPRPHPTSTAPSTVRPGSTKPALQPVQIPGPGIRVTTPLRTATPTGPHPLSAPPLSANSLSTTTSFAAPPQPTTTSNVAAAAPPRGKKREREESMSTPTSNGTITNQVNISGASTNAGITANPTPKAIIGARAGNHGVRPRPIPPPMKKQRLDSQGVGRDTAPVQQHTPV
ncbi:hypothetical protein EV361DRAFT_909740 [Lentinula raphanica]|uniref:Mediator of RNA polymerase II transcription subunit 19 n=1 Tax=Lentinula raphanica TaxID=153919 RepID=A0AA38NYZ4_9AGAR|nr:hypothetical protein C8R42DRAFT_683406 [Lentinula raphanica]KAJ3777113.1 hypothetical protein FB446DRAFT_718699 [Lentinula raphanica]KAJ3833212.1 hypothetical protein F5878DRAFT_633267 [Lentinula raphanica]KAJ3971671.1 hypothetical protein EV361DRAFT_909740 [Lentinula raphanica]